MLGLISNRLSYHCHIRIALGTGCFRGCKFSRISNFPVVLNFGGFNFPVFPSSTVRYLVFGPLQLLVWHASLSGSSSVWKRRWPIEHRFQLRRWWEATTPTRISGPSLMAKSSSAKGKMATGSTLSLYGAGLIELDKVPEGLGRTSSASAK